MLGVHRRAISKDLTDWDWRFEPGPGRDVIEQRRNGQWIDPVQGKEGGEVLPQATADHQPALNADDYEALFRPEPRPLPAQAEAVYLDAELWSEVTTHIADAEVRIKQLVRIVRELGEKGKLHDADLVSMARTIDGQKRELELLRPKAQELEGMKSQRRRHEVRQHDAGLVAQIAAADEVIGVYQRADA